MNPGRVFELSCVEESPFPLSPGFDPGTRMSSTSGYLMAEGPYNPRPCIQFGSIDHNLMDELFASEMAKRLPNFNHKGLKKSMSCSSISSSPSEESSEASPETGTYTYVRAVRKYLRSTRMIKVQHSKIVGAPRLPIIYSFTRVNDEGASFYQSLFPEARNDCYRHIIPWVYRYSAVAGMELDEALPIYGPIASRDLGYLLSHLVYVYDIKDLKLPFLLHSRYNDTSFMHFDSGRTESAYISVVKLLMFPGFVGASLDPMAMIDAVATDVPFPGARSEF